MTWYSPLIDATIALTIFAVLGVLFKALFAGRFKPKEPTKCFRCGYENERDSLSCTRCDPSFTVMVWITCIAMIVGQIRNPTHPTNLLVSGLVGFLLSAIIEFADAMGNRRKARAEARRQ